MLVEGVVGAASEIFSDGVLSIWVEEDADAAASGSEAPSVYSWRAGPGLFKPHLAASANF